MILYFSATLAALFRLTVLKCFWSNRFLGGLVRVVALAVCTMWGGGNGGGEKLQYVTIWLSDAVRLSEKVNSCTDPPLAGAEGCTLLLEIWECNLALPNRVIRSSINHFAVWELTTLHQSHPEGFSPVFPPIFKRKSPGDEFVAKKEKKDSPTGLWGYFSILRIACDSTRELI